MDGRLAERMNLGSNGWNGGPGRGEGAPSPPPQILSGPVGGRMVSSLSTELGYS